MDNNNETMTRDEIMEAITRGDRNIGILFEEVEDQLRICLEDHDRLDKKIDRVDSKLEDFQKETRQNFNLVFEELHAMRKESEIRFKQFESKFQQSDIKFKQFEINFQEIFKRFDGLEGKH